MGSMKEYIRVLIVDDALFMRKAITEILQGDPVLKVVGTARDGLEGLEKIKELRPDVITLDIDMPRMDGLATIRHIMVESPVPVVVLSSLFSDGAVTFEALRLGIVDFIPKPSGTILEDIDRSRRQIIDRVKIASSLNIHNIRRARLESAQNDENLSAQCGVTRLENLIALGTSLSGPNTVIRLLSKLPPTLPAAVIVIQEISPQILPAFASKFQEYVPWEIKMAKNGQIVEQGTCYISSNEHSLRVVCDEDDQKSICLGEKIENPLDLLFISTAEAFKKNAVGVLLTGIGDDGADGFRVIQEKMGITIAQDTKCCVYPNLTQNAIDKGNVSMIVNETQLPAAIASAIS